MTDPQKPATTGDGQTAPPPPDPNTAKLAAAAGAPADADPGDVLRHAADKLDELNGQLSKAKAQAAIDQQTISVHVKTIEELQGKLHDSDVELARAKDELKQVKDDLDAANRMVSEGGATQLEQEAMHADAIKAAERRVELAELHADEIEGRFTEVMDEIATQVDGKNPSMMFRPNLGKIEAYTVTIPAVLLARMMKFKVKRPVAGDVKAEEIAAR